MARGPRSGSALRLPNRSGGPNEHNQARGRDPRRRRARYRPDALVISIGRHSRSRRRPGRRNRQRPWPDRDARAGRDYSAATSTPARHTAAAVGSPQDCRCSRSAAIRSGRCRSGCHLRRPALVRGGSGRSWKKPEIEVVGEAENGAQALALTDRRQPDVILMDIGMPVLDGVQTTRRLIENGSDVKA